VALVTEIGGAGAPPPVNDNGPRAAAGDEPRPRPLVRTSRRRPGTMYATAGNVILPLVFAERMQGWGRASGQSC
jgi:hypothetical protein